MSSLKMTFSLASLVLLVAFGLVFGITSVMADNGGVDTDGDHAVNGHEKMEEANTAEQEDPDHMHPTVVITVQDSDGGTTGVQQYKDAKGMPRVLAPPMAATGNSQATFTLKFTFSNPVNATGTEIILGSEITAGDKDGAIVTGFAVTATTLTAVEASTMEYTSVVTLKDSSAGIKTGPSLVTQLLVELDGNKVKGIGLANLVPTGNQGNLRATPLRISVVKTAPVTPVTKTEVGVTGTPSLTGAFTVTFTSAADKPLMLSATDIEVAGGFVVSGSLSAAPVTAPRMANTVWKAIVTPYPDTEEVSVTIESTSSVAKAAAAAAGKISISKPAGALTSITAPDDADDTAKFVVTLTFAAALPAGKDVVAADLKLTPATATVGATAPNLARTEWQVEITPTAGMDTKVELSTAGKVKFSGTATATVAKAGAVVVTPTPTDITAAYSTTTATTTISAGSIASGGFAVVLAEALPDIQRFFAEGGSISVLSSLTGAEVKSVVISEIMWGLNLRAAGDDRSTHQFIELYNTSGAAIDLKDVKLTFDDANTPPAAPTGMVLLDQISNVSGAGWLISAAPGNSGRIAVSGDNTTFTPLNLVSMYREINYVKVEKADHDADATKNRAAQLKDFPGGSALGSWAASDDSDTYEVNRIGSPGAKHFVAYTTLTATSVPRGTFIINEIGNYENDAYDWVELKRKGGGDNLKKWRLSQVTDDKKDTALVTFPDNNDHKIAADGDVLLIVNSDPYGNPEHPLAAGTAINAPAKNRAETTGLNHRPELMKKKQSRYYVDSGLKLKNSGKTLLILRNSNKNGHLGKSNNIQDVVGTLKIVDNTAGFRTNLWPLTATGGPHDNVIKGTNDEDFRSGKVYRRRDEGGGTGKEHMEVVGYTGLGYKRSAAKSGQNGGTPGYPNGAVIDKDALADSASVTISEVMFARGVNKLPQWIELYNSSRTQAVNLNEWKLKFENDDDVDIRTTVTTNNLGGTIILPNQTVLIVSSTTGRVSRAAQGGIDFPASRVIDMWGQKDKLEVATGLTRRTYSLLSQKAFRITLIAKGGDMVDVVGNLGAVPAWKLPMAAEGEGRSSIIRRYDSGESRYARDGTIGPKPKGESDGTSAWVLASKSSLSYVRSHGTYYGSPDDVGTPGFHGGGALPVSLSKFRPERMKDTGEIVVRWVTESELNNAGFNILRSETRNGEFTKLNTNLIAGQGTISERTVYEYADTSAKPNVVYYYQIQDVSLDGQVQTLRTTHLRGNVTAAGKITTTWGELKALQ